ncbi:MAG: glycosyltransferase family 61 protein [Alphaproteobacteria bacterium]|nr:glycosyltransferase family 61 protein [Alphaproteobacteria bacterium]
MNVIRMASVPYDDADNITPKAGPVQMMVDRRIYHEMTMREWCVSHGQPFLDVVPEGPPVSKVVARPGFDQPAKFKFLQPPKYYGRVAHVHVLPPCGIACTEDGRLLARGFTDRNDMTDRNLVRFLVGIPFAGQFEIAIEKPPPSVVQECVYLGGLGNFGHFLLEKVLRLSLLARVQHLQALPIAVHDDMPSRVYEFLTLTAVPRERMIMISGTQATRFDLVRFLSSPIFRDSKTSDASFWPYALTILRDIAIRPMRTGPRPRRRLFVGRDAARWQRFVNNDEVKVIVAKSQVARRISRQ